MAIAPYFIQGESKFIATPGTCYVFTAGAQAV